MSDARFQYSVDIFRVEVHRANPANDPEETFWQISAANIPEIGLMLLGYLRRAEPDGWAQIQLGCRLRSVTWKEATRSKAARAKFEDWVAEYPAENMYDVARRALQTQAALMDFSFDLDISAPDYELVYQGRETATKTANEA